MSYTPTNWSNKKAPGISDKNLNKIENELVKLDNIVSVPDITETTETTMQNSYDGRLLVNEIGGVCQQGANPSPTSPQEIKKSVVSGVKTHGKNFLDISKVVKGIIDTSTGDFTSNNSWRTSDYVKCDAKSNYCFSQSEDAYAQFNVFFYDKNKSFISSVGKSGQNVLSWTFSAPLNACYMRLCYSEVVNGSTVNRGNLQLEEGTVATEYEPYKESSFNFSNPIDLYGIGDVQDVITPKPIRRKFVEVVFDGSSDEAWQGEKGTEFSRFFIALSKLIDGTSSTRLGNLICTHGTFGMGADEGTIFGYNDGTSSKFYIYANSIQSVDAWKAHLQAKPMTLVYEIAEEVTELPTADQIGLNSLATYDGITYLEIDSEVQPTFEGEYGTSKVGGYTLEALLTARSK